MHKFVVLLWSLCLTTHVTAQFKIIGLLNVAAENEVTIDATLPHQSNAQGRGFSVVRGNAPSEKSFAPSLNSQNNFIKVRVIENDSTTAASSSKTSLRLRNVGAHAETKLRQRPLKPPGRYLMAESYHRRQSNNNIPDNTNQVIEFHNANDLKLHKSAKYRNHYKSKCTCERIANCAKMQMSVSRCKPNYFLCCK